MNLAVRIPEYHLTSLAIARNCNSVWNVCLNRNVNIYKCIKVSLFSSPSYTSFDTEIYHSNIFFCTGCIFPPSHFRKFQRHTADDSNAKKLSNLSTVHTHTPVFTTSSTARYIQRCQKNIHMRISSTSLRSGCQHHRTIILVFKPHPSRIINWCLRF
jgi:hypothetical protein